jgi:hypothetical protein
MERITRYAGYAATLLLCFAFSVQAAQDGDQPVLTFDEVSHDFGTIGEHDGNGTHIFTFTNTGKAELEVTNVQTSCGCTSREWTHGKIAPGQKGSITLTYDTRGRIGAFNKSATVYTNEDNGFKRHRLTITGNVIARPKEPQVLFKDTIFGVALESDMVELTIIPDTKPNYKTQYIKNFNDETVYLTFADVPDYIEISYPDSLHKAWPGEITVSVDNSKTEGKKGRVTENVIMTVQNSEGKKLGSSTITTAINYIDDFSKLSPLQAINVPAADIPDGVVNLGKVSSGFLGIIGGTAKKSFIIKNAGKSDLKLYSITCDNKDVHLPHLNGTSVKAGESFTAEITVKGKELQKDIDTDIVIVCNDPKGPVRRIKVTAQKPD